MFSLTVAERTKPGTRSDIEEQSYTFHVYGRSEGIAGVIITDHEYPMRVAHKLLSMVVDDFLSAHPRQVWATGTPTCPMPQFSDYIVKYQDPKQADSIMKIQQELDETKIVLHKTIESLLERGEKLDSLVERSEALSGSSKKFYTHVCFHFHFFQKKSPFLLPVLNDYTTNPTRKKNKFQAKKQNSCCVVM
jgi:synaptobrevin family protein YKT6